MNTNRLLATNSYSYHVLTGTSCMWVIIKIVDISKYIACYSMLLVQTEEYSYTLIVYDVHKQLRPCTPSIDVATQTNPFYSFLITFTSQLIYSQSALSSRILFRGSLSSLLCLLGGNNLIIFDLSFQNLTHQCLCLIIPAHLLQGK